MPFDKKLVADTVLTRLIENNGLWQKMNRSFDALVRQGASSVDVPSLAIPTVQTSGTALDNSNRKETHTDTTMVNVPITLYAVPLADELIATYESNGMLLREYLDSAAAALGQKFDELVLAAIMGTTTKSIIAGSTIDWADIVAIKAQMDVLKIPANNRILVVDANLEGDFYAIEEVVTALSYNRAYMENGVPRILGMDVWITALSTTTTNSVAHSKRGIAGVYGPGVASILSRDMDVQSAWDTTNLRTAIDVCSHFGAKLLSNSYAVVKYVA